MEESWAQPAIQWLLTPAIITGALYALARLYDPPTRWSRRLKADMAIAGGLPDGEEKRIWEDSFEWRAARLRMYREAFCGWTWFWKWASVAFVGVAVTGIILFPPFNGDYGPADYLLMSMGLVDCGLIAVFISNGYDLTGAARFRSSAAAGRGTSTVASVS
ncbi:hypothetical protein [Microbacterium sp. zg.Y909]|uniref:hypothetical protein n=1 Tax=Microbacterium sp. zg.Y909 TaxID=2969413 RepID=UPI00214BDC33|nr:hypothetical protein [Microbacterium sp. zg.Y909]MCR2825338.1 hypothetical protein [Microbacterium sp. zg.Y909]